MKRIIFCCFLLLSVTAVFSQKLYYVYLQTDTDQPFFVRMNEKTFSSTGSGYLILSQLADSSYTFIVGFSQNKWPDQQFTVVIKSADHGFALKNFGEKGWGLFDLQTLSIQMGTMPSGNRTIKTEPKQVSAFTDVLSKAANDPSLREKPVEMVQPEEKAVAAEPVLKKEEVAINPVAAVPVIAVPVVSSVSAKKEEKAVTGKDPGEMVKTDSAGVVPAVNTDVKEDSKPFAVAALSTSVITKKSESSTTEGFGETFIDEYSDGTKDTVTILIPNPRTLAVALAAAPEEIKPAETPGNTTSAEAALPIVKPLDCTSVAAEADFIKLRRRMVAEPTDDDMVNVAKKTFRTQCFTAEQIKYLSSLFLNDAGKYKFFNAAYPYVSDRANFAALKSELKDDFYLNQFKTLVK